MADPVKLRGHHLISIAKLHEITFEQHTDNLLNTGYILNGSDSFASYSFYQSRSFFADISQRFLIVAESPDFICEACRKMGTCFDMFGRPIPARSVLGPAFLREERLAREESGDEAIAEKYGLKIGKIYTSAEIRQKVGF
jgi:hypothetical protein